ncbi:hypothetical protein MNBD_GAMMA08-34 [hydrothermal vent metagenome]|uniref:Uncharacterized protein n=1 Tax=hydrothermal vent metagenome TaxID=652676 RepID=A0A3B0XKP3_9ZZZZ
MSLSEPVKEFGGKLDRTENQQMIDFLKQHQPSAHADLVRLLVESTEDLPSIKFYCPDTDNHAYYLARTTDGVIFAAAIGMSALMYRLPKQSMSGALVKGGEIFQELGEPWVSFNPFWPDEEHKDSVNMPEMKQWAKLAFHYAQS